MNNEENQHIFSHYENINNKCTHKNCFIEQVRHSDGTLKLRNPHLCSDKNDFLYHLGFGIENNSLCERFNDVKVSNNTYN